MKKLIYYNWTKDSLCDEFGDPISGIPSIAFGEKPQWELAILEEEGGKIKESDLASIAYFRAALDVDFSSSTEVMCRTLPENITSSGNRITLTLDASTETFLAAVDGRQMTSAFFEITGMDAGGSPVFHLLIPVQACMMLDPLLPEDLPPSLSENLWAEKGYVDAALKQLDADGDGITDKAKEAEYATSAGHALTADSAGRADVAGTAESIEWENVQNKVLPSYTAGGGLVLSEELVFSLDTRDAVSGQILTIDAEGNALWATPDSVPEEAVKGIVSSCISSAIILPVQIQGSVASALYAESAGSAGSASSAASAESVLWGGVMEKPETFPPDESLLTSFITSGGSSGQIPIHNGSSFSWQDADLSGGGSLAVSKALITELDDGGYMRVNSVPSHIVTNNGNLYPVSGGFVSSSSEGYFLIDPAPYLFADGESGFSGTWTVYTLATMEETQENE